MSGNYEGWQKIGYTKAGIITYSMGNEKNYTYYGQTARQKRWNLKSNQKNEINKFVDKSKWALSL